MTNDFTNQTQSKNLKKKNGSNNKNATKVNEWKNECVNGMLEKLEMVHSWIHIFVIFPLIGRPRSGKRYHKQRMENTHKNKWSWNTFDIYSKNDNIWILLQGFFLPSFSFLLIYFSRFICKVFVSFLYMQTSFLLLNIWCFKIFTWCLTSISFLLWFIRTV